MQLGNNWEHIDNHWGYLEMLLLAACSGFVSWLVIKKPHDNFIHYLLLGDYIKDYDIIRGRCELTIWFVST